MFTLEKIALEVKGKVVGDSSVQITSVDDINEASEGSITFSFLPKFQKKMSRRKIQKEFPKEKYPKWSATQSMRKLLLDLVLFDDSNSRIVYLLKLL